MTRTIAGIDVHKKMLAVAVATVTDGNQEMQFERRKFPAGADGLQALTDWLLALGQEPGLQRIVTSRGGQDDIGRLHGRLELPASLRLSLDRPDDALSSRAGARTIALH